jgi:hypothetical protein
MFSYCSRLSPSCYASSPDETAVLRLSPFQYEIAQGTSQGAVQAMGALA